MNRAFLFSLFILMLPMACGSKAESATHSIPSQPQAQSSAESPDRKLTEANLRSDLLAAKKDPCIEVLDRLSITAPKTRDTVVTKVSPSICSTLNQVVSAGLTAANITKSDNRHFSTPFVHVDATGNIQLYVYVADGDAATRDLLAKEGIRIELFEPTQMVFQGWLPIFQIVQLAAIPTVKKVTAPGYAIH